MGVKRSRPGTLDHFFCRSQRPEGTSSTPTPTFGVNQGQRHSTAAIAPDSFLATEGALQHQLAATTNFTTREPPSLPVCCGKGSLPTEPQPAGAGLLPPPSADYRACVIEGTSLRQYVPAVPILRQSVYSSDSSPVHTNRIRRFLLSPDSSPSASPDALISHMTQVNKHRNRGHITGHSADPHSTTAALSVPAGNHLSAARQLPPPGTRTQPRTIIEYPLLSTGVNPSCPEGDLAAPSGAGISDPEIDNLRISPPQSPGQQQHHQQRPQRLQRNLDAFLAPSRPHDNGTSTSSPATEQGAEHREGEEVASDRADHEGGNEVEAAAEAIWLPPSKRRRGILGSLMHDRSCYGRLSPAAIIRSQQLMWAGYTELATFPPSGYWDNRSLLANPQMRNLQAHDIDLAVDSVTCLELDMGGQLLLSCQARGTLAVHDVSILRHKASLSTLHRGSSPFPVLHLQTHRRLEAVRWNPSNQNVVAAASCDDPLVQLFDLEYTQGAPCQTLTAHQLPGHMRGLRPATGFTDLQYLGGGQYNIAASCISGQVFLWDARTSKQPRAVLTPPQPTGALSCLQATADGTLILAGSKSGEVLAWDLRGVVGGSARFGAGAHAGHDLLQRTSLRVLMSSVLPPRTLTEGNLVASAVLSCALDPADGRRLAFHLVNGCSGVLDVATQQLTHLYTPRGSLTSLLESADSSFSGQELRNLRAQQAWRLQPRKCAWGSCGSFAVPTAIAGTVHVLDFGPHGKLQVEAAGTASHLSEQGSQQSSLSPTRGHRKGIRDWQDSRLGAVEIGLTDPAVNVAVHQGTQEVFAGTRHGSITLLGRQQSAF